MKMSKRKRHEICLIIFQSCPKAHQLLKNDTDVKHRWSQAVHWLHEQLEVR